MNTNKQTEYCDQMPYDETNTYRHRISSLHFFLRVSMFLLFVMGFFNILNGIYSLGAC